MKCISILPIVLWLLLMSLQTEAQSGMFVAAGPTFSSGNSPNLSRFLASYNEFYNNALEQPFDTTLGTMSGYTIMPGMYVDGILEAGFGISKIYTRRKAEFSNGDQQIMKINSTDYLVDMALGTSLESPVKFSWNLGMSFRSSELRLFYKHSDGLKDYHTQTLTNPGGVNRLSGLYKGWQLSFYTGLSIGANIDDGAARIYLRGDYFFHNKGGVANGPYRDNEINKDGLNGDNSALPSNVTDYYTAAPAVNVFNEAKNDLYGMRFSLVFQVNLGEL